VTREETGRRPVLGDFSDSGWCWCLRLSWILHPPEPSLARDSLPGRAAVGKPLRPRHAGLFAEGMTDELITRLAQISALRGSSRTSVMNYKSADVPARIAHELNLDAIVEGIVARSGERVRITAQLVRVPADTHMWARSYDEDVQDTPALQSEVARDIAEQIQVTLNRQEQAALVKSKTVNPGALRGLHSKDATLPAKAMLP
jgi:TolB-like protein